MSAKKFALQARKRRKTPFLGVLGELFRGSVVVWGVLGELFRGTAVERGRWESFVPGGLLAGGVLGEFCTECVDVRSWVAICSQQMAEPVDGGLLANGGRTRG